MFSNYEVNLRQMKGKVSDNAAALPFFCRYLSTLVIFSTSFLLHTPFYPYRLFHPLSSAQTFLPLSSFPPPFFFTLLSTLIIFSKSFPLHTPFYPYPLFLSSSSFLALFFLLPLDFSSFPPPYFYNILLLHPLSFSFHFSFLFHPLFHLLSYSPFPHFFVCSNDNVPYRCP